MNHEYQEEHYQRQLTLIIVLKNATYQKLLQMIALMEGRLQIGDHPTKRQAVVPISQVQKSTPTKSLHDIVSHQGQHIESTNSNKSITLAVTKDGCEDKKRMIVITITTQFLE